MTCQNQGLARVTSRAVKERKGIVRIRLRDACGLRVDVLPTYNCTAA
jgi:hypothetical protein